MSTFATETRSSRLPVQELVDAILDYLHDSRQDLTACSLVSHSFVHRAQSHLFRSIALDVDEEHRAGMSMSLVEKAQRLADILATSPHLVVHIRTLSSTTRALLPLAQVRLTNLHTASFRADSDHPMSYLSLEASMREIIESFVANSAMRSLTLEAFWAQRDIWRILASCNPNLTTITFIQFRTRGGDASASDFPRPKGSARPRITHLGLSYATCAGEMLCDPASPLDLSALACVSVRSSQDRLLNLLVPIRDTITCVDMVSEGYHRTLDLNALPAVRHLAIDQYAFAKVLPKLRAPNKIDTISFTHKWGSRLRESWPGYPFRHLQNAILEAELPSLLRVEVEVSLMGADETEVKERIEGLLVRLREKFAVSIRFDPADVASAYKVYAFT
ncbi:hypothetical protein C8R44DRAFT_740239 [Mycena epipterygia]|nr:hypothetical protein C8R44DRAFT_740239 [Mycena epipterygia]